MHDIHHLGKNDLIAVHLEAVLRLLNWLLSNTDEPMMFYDDLEKLIFRSPKKKSLLGLLDSI